MTTKQGNETDEYEVVGMQEEKQETTMQQDQTTTQHDEPASKVREVARRLTREAVKRVSREKLLWFAVGALMAVAATRVWRRRPAPPAVYNVHVSYPHQPMMRELMHREHMMHRDLMLQRALVQDRYDRMLRDALMPVVPRNIWSPFGGFKYDTLLVLPKARESSAKDANQEAPQHHDAPQHKPATPPNHDNDPPLIGRNALRTMTIKQLREYLAKHNAECKACVEKDDLVNEVLRLRRASHNLL